MHSLYNDWIYGRCAGWPSACPFPVFIRGMSDLLSNYDHLVQQKIEIPPLQLAEYRFPPDKPLWNHGYSLLFTSFLSVQSSRPHIPPIFLVVLVLEKRLTHCHHALPKINQFADKFALFPTSHADVKGSGLLSYLEFIMILLHKSLTYRYLSFFLQQMATVFVPYLFGGIPGMSTFSSSHSVRSATASSWRPLNISEVRMASIWVSAILG